VRDLPANMKPAESLTVADLQLAPVWQFINRDDLGETMVRPVKRLPVRSASGKLIGTEVRFANGTTAWALIGNLSGSDPRLSEHFLSLSIAHGGKWFHLARYHDHDFERQGPQALARLLSLDVDEVFPIAFDVRQYVEGEGAALRREIPKEPRERLSRSQLMAMVLDDMDSPR